VASTQKKVLSGRNCNKQKSDRHQPDDGHFLFMECKKISQNKAGKS